MAGAIPYVRCLFCKKRVRKAEITQHELECLEGTEDQAGEDSEHQHDDNSNKRQPPTSKKHSPKQKSPARTNNETERKKAKIDKGQANITSESKKNYSENPTTSSTEEQPLPQAIKQDSSKEKEALKEVAYPKVSKEMMIESESSYKEPLGSKDSLPLNAVVKNDPKQAWNANAPRRMSGKPDDPFPPVKKYRHHPVYCEFCHRKFQPGPLRKHIQKYHPDEHLPPGMQGRDQGRIRPPDPREEKQKRKSPPSGPPRALKVCYICGRMFGSKSLKIHEPQCLKKWKIQNENLPKHKRMPEPIKPELISESTDEQSLPGSSPNPQQNLPELDAEAEAAYRCHLKNLVPCSYCGRTFVPDRVMVHENACVERPKQRTHKTKR